MRTKKLKKRNENRKINKKQEMQKKRHEARTASNLKSGRREGFLKEEILHSRKKKRKGTMKSYYFPQCIVHITILERDTSNDTTNDSTLQV